ncbi:MAG: hypothetical protein BGO09_14895 [Bacteroidetes bacterium 47-18]|nr:MAG: hypothetical protein BGO09_14895 [Bacteroidetes bacterium 47-18]
MIDSVWRLRQAQPDIRRNPGACAYHCLYTPGKKGWLSYIKQQSDDIAGMGYTYKGPQIIN